MKQISFYIVIFIALILAFFLLLKNHQLLKNNFEIKLNDKRNFHPISLKLKAKVEFNEMPYRLLPFSDNDSIIVFLQNGIYVFDQNLRGRKITPKSGYEKGLYYLYSDKSKEVGFSFTRNESYLFSNNNFTLYKSSGQSFNSIYNNQAIYSMVGEMKYNLFAIEKQNIANSERKILKYIPDLFKSELKGYKSCLEQTLDGNFFIIDQQTIGYFFYKAGFLIKISNDSVTAHKTIVSSPFLKYQEKEFNFNGFKGIECSTAEEIWTQLSACSNGINIYVLSNMSNSLKRIIDIYDAKTMKYKESYVIPNYRNQKPSDILIRKNRLVISFEKGNLISYDIQ